MHSILHLAVHAVPCIYAAKRQISFNVEANVMKKCERCKQTERMSQTVFLNYTYII